MTRWTTPLQPGLPISFDGEQFTVAEIEGRRILLRPTAAVVGMPRWRQLDISVLPAHPTTEILVPAPREEPTAAAILGGLDDGSDDELTRKFRHVQEVRTGYQLGSEELALPGEPRPDYAPGTPWMHRYAAKATELGVAESTIRNWVWQVERSGPAGLVRERPAPSVPDRADDRWLGMARSVLEEHEKSSRPVRNLILAEIEERLTKEDGRETVPVPARTTGYELLRALAKGTNAFEGSTKGKRSIADAPKGTYGRLRAPRPGEYVVLDTNCLDVFAMEPVTCRWVRCELTVAMDLYSRCITGLRLTPVSTKSTDVAGVLFETVRPREAPEDGGELLPYCGVPSAVVVDANKLVDRDGQPLLPTVAAETIIFDHGKVYLSNRIQSVCAKLDISLQPARPKTPTDKPVERWFRSLNQGLLAARLQGLGRPQPQREGRGRGVLLHRRTRSGHPRVDHSDLSPSPPPRTVCPGGPRAEAHRMSSRMLSIHSIHTVSPFRRWEGRKGAGPVRVVRRGRARGRTPRSAPGRASRACAGWIRRGS
ncbi:hypothetical protein [Streptomyces sp. NPDC020747]|uniref:hypothetical protein n=1 Tax=Streptomyces sp. NPDC020747 TaxID=3365086 RepID=UPI0037B0EBD8